MSEIAQSGDGVLKYGEPSLTNELLNDSKPGNEDPPAYRGGTHVGGSLRKDSGDRITSSNRLERTVIIHKEDADGAGRLEFYTQGPGQSGDMNASHLRLVLSKHGVGLSGFRSPNGRWLWNFQDDGHQVQYDTHHPAFATADPSAAAVWSNWFGIIRPLPWV